MPKTPELLGQFPELRDRSMLGPFFRGVFCPCNQSPHLLDFLPQVLLWTKLLCTKSEPKNIPIPLQPKHFTKSAFKKQTNKQTNQPTNKQTNKQTRPQTFRFSLLQQNDTPPVPPTPLPQPGRSGPRLLDTADTLPGAHAAQQDALDQLMIRETPEMCLCICNVDPGLINPMVV